MAGRPWSDEELGIIQDLSLTPRQAGEAVGRSHHAVRVMRKKLELGFTGSPRTWWTDEEDAFIRNTPHLHFRTVAQELGRTDEAVKSRRHDLGVKVGAEVNQATFDPCAIAHRPLVARTCHHCGLLLDASWFTCTQPTGDHVNRRWSNRCARCFQVKYGKRYGSKPQPLDRRRARDKVLAKLTEPTASKAGQPYTTAEEKVLADPDLTLLEKAIKLNRTYKAVQVACSRHGCVSKVVRRGDPENVQWRIVFPNAHKENAA